MLTGDELTDTRQITLLIDPGFDHKPKWEYEWNGTGISELGFKNGCFVINLWLEWSDDHKQRSRLLTGDYPKLFWCPTDRELIIKGIRELHFISTFSVITQIREDLLAHDVPEKPANHDKFFIPKKQRVYRLEY